MGMCLYFLDVNNEKRPIHQHKYQTHICTVVIDLTTTAFCRPVQSAARRLSR